MPNSINTGELDEISNYISEPVITELESVVSNLQDLAVSSFEANELLAIYDKEIMVNNVLMIFIILSPYNHESKI